MPYELYSDVELLALCIWREARGEGQDGMRAVAHVINNRVGKEGFGSTFQSVILGKNQFTSMSVPTDPEFNLMPDVGDPQYSYCLALAPTVLGGTDPDLTTGACYYANIKEATSGWFFKHIVNDPVNHPLLATIGHQNFYK